MGVSIPAELKRPYLRGPKNFSRKTQRKEGPKSGSAESCWPLSFQRSRASHMRTLAQRVKQATQSDLRLIAEETEFHLARRKAKHDDATFCFQPLPISPVDELLGGSR